jgi:hypothetical protein
MKPIPLMIGKDLIKEGDTVKHIYLVAQGEFEVTKMMYYTNKDLRFNQEIDFDNIEYSKYT